MTVKFRCTDCGAKLPPGFERLRGFCEDCAKKRCQEKGEHTWEPAAIGPGVAVFDCLYCSATSDGTLEPLKQLGFQEIMIPSPEDGE